MSTKSSRRTVVELSIPKSPTPSQTTSITLAALLAGGLAFGCGDSSSAGTNRDGADGSGDADPSEILQDVDGTGTLEIDSAAPDSAFDTGEDSVDRDTIDPDASDPCVADPGGLLCPCDANTDCNSGYCIPSRTGDQVCTKVCEEECPDGLECRLVSFPGQDATFLCIDLAVNVCRPCRANSDCQGSFGTIDNRCVAHSDIEGAFCGIGCSESNPCPSGYTCDETEDIESGSSSRQCVPDDGTCECSQRAIQEQASTACYKDQCAGSRLCSAQGLTACSAADAVTEICDGIDNNCEGTIDEGFPNTDGDAAADCVDTDDDGDGSVDESDNCPLVINDQTDTDGDGIGDACDPPDAPVLLQTVPASPANDNQPVVTGTAPANHEVTLYAGGCSGTPLATVTADAAGNFSVIVVVAEDSATLLFARDRNSANGLASACSAVGLAYIEDSTAPLAPTLSGTIPTSPGNTNDFSVTGQADAGTTVTLYSDASCTTALGATAIAGIDGKFTIASSLPANATEQRFVNARDAAGNVSACSNGVSYTEDSVAPDAPAITLSIPASPSGSNTTPTLVGEAEPGALVTIYASEGCAGEVAFTTNANGNGIWTATIAVLPNSVTTFSATATDVAANASDCSPEGLVYIHDDEDPSAPTLAGTTPASPGKTTTPSVYGTTEPNSLVRLYLGDDCTGFLVGETTADETGAFTVQVQVAANAETLFYGRSTDLSGRVSECSEPPLSYAHDGIAPLAPVLTGTDPVSPARNPTPSVKGTGETGATVTLYTSATCTTPAVGTQTPPGLATSIVVAAGTFATPVALPLNATTTLWATLTDPAGNVSPCSTSKVVYTHDDKAPATPTITATRPESPSGELNPTLVGKAEANAAVDIYKNATCTGTPIGSGVSDVAGDFEVAVVATENAVTSIYATATDAAGNISPCTPTALTYEHDDSQPLVPAFTGVAPESPNNDSTSPTISGTAEAGTTVRLHQTSDCSGSPVGSGPATDGVFTIEVAVAPNSTTTFYASSIDAAQNVSPCSAQGLVYVHDSLVPATPTFEGTTASPTKNITPNVRGVTEPGVTVQLFNGIGCTELIGTTTAGGAGNWSLTVTVGDNTVTTFCAIATDAAGNASGHGTHDYVHDTQPPSPPTLTSTNPASPGADLTPAVTGGSEALATITFYASTCSGSVIGTGTVANNGSFTIDVGVGANVTTQIVATSTDTAQNTSGCSTALPYINDSTAPDAPTWNLPDPTSPNNDDATPRLSGTTEASATVQLYTNLACSGSPTTTTTATGAGVFEFNPTVTANVAAVFYANAIDGVGGVSACSAGLNYLYDTALPATPTIAPEPASPNQDPTPDFKGTAEAASTLTVYTSNTCTTGSVGTVTVPGNGNWTLANVSVPLNQQTTYYAASVDTAGNSSVCSAGAPYRHDTLKPNAPAVTGVSPASPGNDPTPDVSGSVGEVDTTIRLYSNSTCTTLLGTLNNGPLSWTVTSNALAAGPVTFWANATDKALNKSDCSASSVPYVYDPQAPNAPTNLVTNPTPWSRTDNTPDVSGKAEANSKVRIYKTSNCTGAFVEATANGSGDFSTTNYDIGPDNQDVSFSATATDAALNTSACSASVTFRFDNTAPNPFVGASGAVLGAGVDATSKVTVSWPLSPDTSLKDNLSANTAITFVTCISELCGAADCDFPADISGAKYRTVAANTASYQYTGLSANTRYYFKVRAVDELGNRETNDKVVSVKTQGLNSAIDLFVGEAQSVLRLADGTRKSWGGTSGVPTGNTTDPTRYNLGSSHSCLMERAGQPKCWGANTYGQLGNGATIDQAAPVNVSNITTTGVEIDVGLEHTCALLSDGQVRCWGRNATGQLGRALTSDKELVPVTVYSDVAGTTALTNIVQIAVGDNHACALRGDGNVFCWGDNARGQLGTNSRTNRNYAVQSQATDMIQLVAGQAHTCGLKSTGAVQCWGDNSYGQLGDGSVVDDALVPTNVSGISNALSLGTSRLHICATLADGTAKCWGRNQNGEIGNNSIVTPVRIPAAVQSLSDIREVSGGDGFSCARLADGTSKCWGLGQNGRLGTGNNTSSLVPVLVTIPLGVAGVTETAIDFEHGCAAVADGTAACWGKNSNGQLGNTANGPAASQLTRFSAAGIKIVDVETGGSHSCALRSDGNIMCVGLNDKGQLGLGNTTSTPTPTLVPSFTGIKALALGTASSCALTAAGDVSCWGDHADGKLGVGAPTGNVTAPKSVTGLPKVKALAVGWEHQCALSVAGEVWCWGKNDKGQVTGTVGTFITSATKVTGVANAVAIATGGAHSCALLADGTAKCWGDNASTQLGVTGTSNAVQTVGSLTGALFISAGGRTTCALKINGAAQCWGSNATGATGNGSGTASFSAPQNVTLPGSPNNRVTHVSEGDDNACMTTSAGNAYCWGSNDSLALGTGDAANKTTPTQVICLP